MQQDFAYRRRALIFYLLIAFIVLLGATSESMGAIGGKGIRHNKPKRVIDTGTPATKNLSNPDTAIKDNAGETPSGPASQTPEANEDATTDPALKAMQEARSKDTPPAQAHQEKGTVVLNFSEASLKDILRTIGEITGENFIIAPGVSAKISVQTVKPVLRKDVFGIFESILEVNGLSAVKSGTYYKIVPAPSAKQHSLEVSSMRTSNNIPDGDKVINLIIPMEFVSANDIMQIIKPSLSAAGSITSYQKTNTLIITDVASNIKGHLDIINLLDEDTFKRMKIAVFVAKNVEVKTLNRELSDVFSALGLGKETALSVVTIERLNSLIVFSASEAILASAKEWIERLDQSSSADTASIHIYYVQNDKASNISGIIERLYGGKKVTLSALTPDTRVTPHQAATQGGAPAGAKADSTAKGGDAREDEIKIFIYEPSNAIIIQASQRDYQNILNTVKELDRIPKQVMIDAMIVEVKLDEESKYGIQWSAISGNYNFQQNTQIVSTTINSPKALISTPVGASTPAGLAVFATDKASKFFGLIQALATTGKIDVLSNPHIIVKNYEKATINVGSDEPVATQSTQTAVTGTSGLIQNIEYRKTGVILTITPQITDGGMIAMTIKQEVSDKSTDRTVGNATYPSFSKRETETVVITKDRDTLVIGGLIQEKKNKTTTGIPLLSEIPVLGNLFKYTVKSVERTELVMLLTPTVVSNSEQAASVSDEFKGKLSGIAELLKKRGKTSEPKAK